MIKAEMNYELSDMRALSLRNKKPSHFIISTVVVAFCMINFALLLLLAEDMKVPGLGVALPFLCFAAAALYCWFTLFILVIGPKSSYKGIKNFTGDNPMIFTFSDSSFEIRCDNGENHQNSVIAYESLFNAEETSDYFFLFINKGGAYVIKKSSFTEGTPEELSALLLEKLGGGFKRKYK